MQSPIMNGSEKLLWLAAMSTGPSLGTASAPMPSRRNSGAYAAIAASPAASGTSTGSGAVA